VDAPAIFTQGLTRRFGISPVQDVKSLRCGWPVFGSRSEWGRQSTTIKMLTGLMAPTAGAMQILGLDLATTLRGEVNRVVPEGMALLGRLTGSSANFAGRMYGLDRDTAAQRCASCWISWNWRGSRRP
jgi:ABC-2 type transport system ATP-binding protein